MIHISSYSGGGGSVKIYEAADVSKLGDESARIIRQATLDGGAVLTHLGVSAGDRTFRIAGTLSETDEATLKTIFRAGSLASVSTRDGFFDGAIEFLSAENGKVEIKFLVKEKIV